MTDRNVSGGAGIFVTKSSGLGGFRVTVPTVADGEYTTLRLYVGVFGAQGRLTASLSAGETVYDELFPAEGPSVLPRKAMFELNYRSTDGTKALRTDSFVQWPAGQRFLWQRRAELCASLMIDGGGVRRLAALDQLGDHGQDRSRRPPQPAERRAGAHDGASGEGKIHKPAAERNAEQVMREERRRGCSNETKSAVCTL